MLAKYLHKLRAERVLSESARALAMESLSENWNFSDGKLTKDFLFPSYEGANNFLLRYNQYCSKINRKPRWKNIYNTVTIQLHDTEFEDVTTKEIEVAKYLDIVYDVTLNYEDLCDEDKVENESILLPKAQREYAFNFILFLQLIADSNLAAVELC